MYANRQMTLGIKCKRNAFVLTISIPPISWLYLHVIAIGANVYCYIRQMTLRIKFKRNALYWYLTISIPPISWLGISSLHVIAIGASVYHYVRQMTLGKSVRGMPLF